MISPDESGRPINKTTKTQRHKDFFAFYPSSASICVCPDLSGFIRGFFPWAVISKSRPIMVDGSDSLNVQ